MSKSLPLVFCFDAAFAPYAAAATISVLENNDQETVVYWVFPAEAEIIVESLSRRPVFRQADIRRRAVNDLPFRDWKEFDHISWGTYLRLVIPDVVQEMRVLYVDSDALVMSSMDALEALDLGNDLLAGAHDRVAEESTKVPRLPNDPYINAGVMLMNLEEMRKAPLMKHAASIYQAYQSDIVWPSQDLINKYGEGRKQILDDRWNLQIYSQTSRGIDSNTLNAIQDSAITHFVGGVKPWSVRSEPSLANLWWTYGRRLRHPRLILGRIIQIILGSPFERLSFIIQRLRTAQQSPQLSNSLLQRRADFTTRINEE